MPGSGSDCLADLTTDLVFHDAVYYHEALFLPGDQNEDRLETELVTAARESGIDNPYSFLCLGMPDIPKSVSTMSQRSSISIRSEETHSTGFTSQPSPRTSRDHAVVPMSPESRMPPSFSRASYSMDHTNYQSRSSFLDVPKRHSTSTFSLINSDLSDALSVHTPSPLKRKSGLFSRFRKESSFCSSRSHHGHLSKPQSRKLDCGHSLTKHAIRVHVQEALASKEQIAPACCGLPLPKDVLQMILSDDELAFLARKTLSLPDVGSLRDSGYGEQFISSVELPRLNSEALSTIPTIVHQEPSQIDENSLTLALANEAFRSLKKEQKDQFQCVAAFESDQRKALAAHYRWSLQRLSSQLAYTKAERIKQHPVELERLDEFQINMEHDLREAHATEKQNVATALKYMTAYCTGRNPTDPSLVHAVTEEDWNKLKRQSLIQRKLPAKHEGAINVLRAKQERDTKNRLQKQKKELQQLDVDYEKNKISKELQYTDDSNRLNETIQARRARIMKRWDLRFEMWRNDYENQHGIALYGRIPHEVWPGDSDTNSDISASSSLAVYSRLVS